MEKSNKKRGFRPIIVNEIDFNWCFKGVIDVRPKYKKANILTIDFGWYGEWEYVTDNENKPPGFEPKVVTPKFVSNAIKYALDNGWNTALKNNRYSLVYKNGSFIVLR